MLNARTHEPLTAPSVRRHRSNQEGGLGWRAPLLAIVAAAILLSVAPVQAQLYTGTWENLGPTVNSSIGATSVGHSHFDGSLWVNSYWHDNSTRHFLPDGNGGWDEQTVDPRLQTSPGCIIDNISISDDGLRLYAAGQSYYCPRPGWGGARSAFIFELERADTSQSWDTATIRRLGERNFDTGFAAPVSYDNLSLLFHASGRTDILTRPNTSVPFFGGAGVTGARISGAIRNPRESADHLELYFSRDADLYRRTRTSTATPWDDPAVVASEQLIVTDALVGIPLPDGRLIISSLNRGGFGDWDLFVSSQPINDMPPTAKAGSDQSIRAGVTAQLDGSQSFDDNTPSTSLQYTWSFASVPAGSTAVLNGANTATPSFTADVSGTYTVQLVVTDNAGQQSAPDDVVLSDDNMAPTAVAGSDQLIFMGTTAMLDGSASSDPENDSLTYAWTIVSQPAGSTAALSAPGAVTPTLTPDLVGEYVVQLVVSDFLGAGAPAKTMITATTPGLYAKDKIMQAYDIVQALSPAQVTNKGNQNAFLNHLANAIKEIDKGKYVQACGTLESAIERADGCVSRGAADGNGKDRDWVTDCTPQTQVYHLLDDASDALNCP